MKKHLGLAFVGLFCSFPLVAEASNVEDWLRVERARAWTKLNENLNLKDVRPGAVVASPSREEPNYFFHWVRDAALVMDIWVRLFRSTNDDFKRDRYFEQIHKYIQFSIKLQNTAAKAGLGEPKFFPDGKAFNDEWGRPQNDGPALRALSLTRLAKFLIVLGQEEYVENYLFDPSGVQATLITNDCDYVASQWREKNFDLWEEVKGDHFFTLLVQRRALIEAAELAESMRNFERAQLYKETAKEIQKKIGKFWNSEKGVVRPTINRVSGIEKESQLDSSVLIASLVAEGRDDFFRIENEMILSTFTQLILSFHSLYEINGDPQIPGLGLGRYPEDRYDGVRTDRKGNPWFLITLAGAEAFYRLQTIWAKRDIEITETNLKFFEMLMPSAHFQPSSVLKRGSSAHSQILKELQVWGDALLMRVAYHSDRQTGAMSEQFDRDTGFSKGAKDLSWSYSALLRAAWARK